MTGLRNPAEEAMSTNRALKGRPEGAGLARGFVVWVAIPWPRSCRAVAKDAKPRKNRTKLRRAKSIIISVIRDREYPDLGSSLASKLDSGGHCTMTFCLVPDFGSTLNGSQGLGCDGKRLGGGCQCLRTFSLYR